MRDRWQDDPDLMGTAIDKVVKRALRTSIHELPEPFWQAIVRNVQQPLSQQRSNHAVLASVCRERVLAVCRGEG